MNRRDFIATAALVTAASACRAPPQAPEQARGFSASTLRDVDYIETNPCCPQELRKWVNLQDFIRNCVMVVTRRKVAVDN